MRFLLAIVVIIVVDDFSLNNNNGHHRSVLASKISRNNGNDGDSFRSSTKDKFGSGGSSLTPKKHSIIDDYDYSDELLDETEEKDMSHWDDKCPPEIEGRCHCGHQRDPFDRSRIKYVVNCTDAGFTSAKPLQFIPENTELLIVRRNKIREFPINVFGNKTYKNLKEIDLRENEIEDIKGRSFHHVSFVETLILNYNKISKSTIRDHPRLFSNFVSLKNLHLTGAFEKNDRLMEDLLDIFKESNLTKLEKIHLEQNDIDRISQESQFCDFPSLMDIHLANNRISDLKLDTDCTPSLRFVDLAYNQVKTVREESGLLSLVNTMNQRGEPIRVDMYDNPFRCDCELNPYLQWLKNMSRIDPDRLQHRKSLRCKTGLPESNAGRLLISIQNTTCPVLYSSNAVINTMSWTILTLIITASLVLLLGAYFYKTGPPAWVQTIVGGAAQSPLLMTTQGVKYTSVEKEEASEVAHV